ncbi:MAG: DUF1080 domain-containing protein [Bacteroidia bacterium]|nr:DUF1080 domain-containing protein [Bacteroidia bacterium]
MIRKLLLLTTLGSLLSPLAVGQSLGTMLKLDDLSAFDKPGSNWQLASSVQADLTRNETLSASPGKGILVNLPSDKAKADLYSTFEHGDADVELEFMMAMHSNSGIYLQGQYEIQLLDSYGKTNITYGDCGGIYQRWDEARGEGNEGYEGHAPRMNVAKAPGLWQHLAISFQAARFDEDGNKVAPAKILSVSLNGQLIHQNVILTGPTRGSDYPKDIPKGPLRIQGDHGPVAFRNIKINNFDSPPASISGLTYGVYTGIFEEMPTFSALTPVASGSMEALTAEVVNESEDFILRVNGEITFPRDGDYLIDLNTLGNGQITIAGKPVINYGWWAQQGTYTATAGTVPFELLYHKRDSWYNNGFSLAISGPGLRQQRLSLMSSMPLGSPTQPIYIGVGATEKIMRCFIDYQDESSERRIVHAISVGSPKGVHFTYDPDRAALVQAWKGEYLDATPMWHDRGDGSSSPRGAVQPFGDKAGIAFATGQTAPWPDELPEALGYHFEGYAFPPHSDSYNPSFRYGIGDATITDTWIAEEEQRGIQRVLTLSGQAPRGAILRVAHGSSITKVTGEAGSETYSIDQRYYVKMPVSQAAEIIQRDGVAQLVIDLSLQSAPIIYAIEW